MNTKAGFPANMRQYLKLKSKLKNKNKRALMLHILINYVFRVALNLNVDGPLILQGSLAPSHFPPSV